MRGEGVTEQPRLTAERQDPELWAMIEGWQADDNTFWASDCGYHQNAVDLLYEDRAALLAECEARTKEAEQWRLKCLDLAEQLGLPMTETRALFGPGAAS